MASITAESGESAALVRPSRHHGERILAVVNQKGGVGKTTTAINLGTALAVVGEPVLIIDLDPQGNASTGLGLDRNAREFDSYKVLMGDASLDDAIVPTNVPNLYVVPSTLDLSGAELELFGVARRSFRLRDALISHQSQPGTHRFAYVLIDCPPSLNTLTINALAAADGVLVPLQCEFFALEGLSQLIKTIDLVRSNLNPALEIQGVVLTMFDRRNNLSVQVEADVRAHFGDKVYRTVIPRNVRISEAPSHGKPALLYDYRAAGSQAYMRLASEMLQRERRRHVA
jgi:chromosome partitioning protein